jgi:hypothetical protein
MYLQWPDRYYARFISEHDRIRGEIYGYMADAHAAERCYARLVGVR